MTVACDRDPDAIAKSITRRILPGYLAAYREASAREAADKAEQAEAEALAVELAGICGGEISHNDARKFYLYGEHRIDGHVTYGAVDLKFGGLSNEMARRVLRLLCDVDVL